jgi:diadenosine tetraphosphate (Ap4A) HIT family hydrolase
MATLFTRIINGELPGRFVWADPVCVAFASINPLTDGHMLVVPRQETERFTELDEQTLSHVMVVAQRIGRAQERVFGAPRAMLAIAGLEVPHTHVHVFPAWTEGQLNFALARQDVPPDELDAATERVRAGLRELGFGQFVPSQMDSPEL